MISKIKNTIKIGDPCNRRIDSTPPCVGVENCIWVHCYYVKKYKERLGMLYYEYTLTTIRVKMFLVLCHCGYSPEITDHADYSDVGPWQAKCSNPYCSRNVTAKTEKEVCEKWNIKYDWHVHELISVFSEKEYTKMVKDCGGHIETTPWWEERKHKPCKHCERRERIKESIIKELNIDK